MEILIPFKIMMIRIFATTVQLDEIETLFPPCFRMKSVFLLSVFKVQTACSVSQRWLDVWWCFSVWRHRFSLLVSETVKVRGYSWDAFIRTHLFKTPIIPRLFTRQTAALLTKSRHFVAFLCDAAWLHFKSIEEFWSWQTWQKKRIVETFVQKDEMYVCWKR